MENQINNEDLSQIQERGLAWNAEARIRILPTAEEVVNGLSQSDMETAE